METIEQGLRRIFKNAPHIYAECVRCAKERPVLDWKDVRYDPIFASHYWSTDSYNNKDLDYWRELNRKANAGEEIGPDYPLPPDSPIRQKEVGNWYKCIDGNEESFNTGGWYRCIRPTNKPSAFIDNEKTTNGWFPKNHERFD